MGKAPVVVAGVTVSFNGCAGIHGTYDALHGICCAVARAFGNHALLQSTDGLRLVKAALMVMPTRMGPGANLRVTLRQRSGGRCRVREVAGV